MLDPHFFIKHLQNEGLLEPRFEEDGVTPTANYLREEEKIKDLLKAFDMIGNYVNGSNANAKVFAEAICKGIGHRHLHSEFNGMVIQYIGFLASDEYATPQYSDGRNIGWHDAAKRIVESCEENNYNPFGQW